MKIQYGRRRFLVVSGKGVLTAALLTAEVSTAGFLLTGCAITLDDIKNWTQEAADALGTVMTLLGAVGIACAACLIALPVAIAAINAIAGAITAYENAPAADKATLWGKILTALQAAFDQVTAFFQTANIPGASIANMIVNIASLVLSAITGFIQKFFPNAAAWFKAKKAALGSGQAIPIIAKQYNPDQFKSAFNAIVVAGGHPEVQLR
jgi:hypothetical protein